MTTLTMSTQHRNYKAWLFALVGLVIFIAWVVGPDTITNDHAVIEHGPDAMEVRCAFRENGFFQSFQESESGRWHFLVNLPDGRVGDHIACYDNGQWWEITSFIPKMGVLTAVLAWVTKRARRKNLDTEVHP